LGSIIKEHKGEIGATSPRASLLCDSSLAVALPPFSFPLNLLSLLLFYATQNPS